MKNKVWDRFIDWLSHTELHGLISWNTPWGERPADCPRCENEIIRKLFRSKKFKEDMRKIAFYFKKSKRGR